MIVLLLPPFSRFVCRIAMGAVLKNTPYAITEVA